jgi:hypothetical protein
MINLFPAGMTFEAIDAGELISSRRAVADHCSKRSNPVLPLHEFQLPVLDREIGKGDATAT